MALAALPHSQAARDSESYHHEEAPSRSLRSTFEDDEQMTPKWPSSSASSLKYKTIMLKVSGEALQVGGELLMF